MRIHGDRPCSQVSISAISPPASSAIQAEAFGLLFAFKLAEMLNIHQATFLTDNATLATAAATQDLLHAPGHGQSDHNLLTWQLRLPLVIQRLFIYQEA
jgi:hypothetical protein